MSSGGTKGRQGRQKPIGVREASKMRYSPQQVGKALEARRMTLGLSRTALGRKIGIDAETIRNWENGKAPVIACRVFSWLLAESHDGSEELWRERALLAEAALRDMQAAMVTYQGVSDSPSAYADARRTD